MDNLLFMDPAGAEPGIGQLVLEPADQQLRVGDVARVKVRIQADPRECVSFQALFGYAARSLAYQRWVPQRGARPATDPHDPLRWSLVMAEPADRDKEFQDQGAKLMVGANPFIAEQPVTNELRTIGRIELLCLEPGDHRICYPEWEPGTCGGTHPDDRWSPPHVLEFMNLKECVLHVDPANLDEGDS